ncbi:MAG: poly(ADP-ribose) glycohydrolase [Planctomycetota bacterium]|nr:poly(ADP-ribose) glycohydrolase [Planctomycetota bacterium]
MRAHPPKLKHPHKKAVFALAAPEGAEHRGTLEFSRWCAAKLPELLPVETRTRIEARETSFEYAQVDEAICRAWHLNFADMNLFGFYGGALFAQDEMQVAEHPALASLREALPKFGHKPLTVEDNQPTPVLVADVERRCKVATERNVEEGRPAGLYGNAFAAAPIEVVKKAVKLIEPPTRSNLIAMEAPSYGRGAYTAVQLEYVLRTAFTGFAAARQESARLNRGSAMEVVVHTGFWGCGAFGGNRIVMTILQILAARLAGLDRIVVHTLDAQGSASFERARELLEGTIDKQDSCETARALSRVEALRLEWGVSDGN